MNIESKDQNLDTILKNDNFEFFHQALLRKLKLHKLDHLINV